MKGNCVGSNKNISLLTIRIVLSHSVSITMRSFSTNVGLTPGNHYGGEAENGCESLSSPAPYPQSPSPLFALVLSLSFLEHNTVQFFFSRSGRLPLSTLSLSPLCKTRLQWLFSDLLCFLLCYTLLRL